MFPRRKRHIGASREATPVIQRLDPRLILDAPLALASDELLLSDPTPDELLEPAVLARPAAEQPAPARVVELPLATTTSCTPVYVSVICLGGVWESDASVPSQFRFFASTCATLAPASVTVSYSRDGTATPDVDYTGLSGSVTIPINPSTGTGQVDVDYYAVDDSEEEPQTPESVIVTIIDGEDYDPIDPVSATGSVASNDYKASAGLGDTQVKPGETVNRFVKIQKDGQRVNGIVARVVSVKDADGQAVPSIETDPIIDSWVRSDRHEVSPGVFEDGVAKIQVTAGAGAAPGTTAYVTVRFEPPDATGPADPRTVTFKVTVVE